MNRLKELKRRVAALLIVTMASANMMVPTFANAGDRLVLDNKSLTMQVGDTATITASFESDSKITKRRLTAGARNASGGDATGGDATGGDASGSDADLTKISWKSDQPELVEIVGADTGSSVTVKAVKHGSPVKITASYEGMASVDCVVTLKAAPAVTVSPSKRTIDYSGSAEISADLKNYTVSEDGSVRFEAQADQDGLSIEPGDEEGQFTVTTDGSGFSGDYTITVSAYDEGSSTDDPVAAGTMTLTVKAPAFKLNADKKEIDVNGNEMAVLSVDSELVYDEYKWSVSGDGAVAMASSSDAEMEITAEKAGDVVVSVDAVLNNDPTPTREVVANAKASSKLTIHVVDTRIFLADKETVTLDINRNEPKLSDIITLTNDFGDDFKVRVEGNSKVSAVADGNQITVSTLATEVGTAAVIIERAGGEVLKIMVNIINTEIPVQIETGVETEIDGDAIKEPVFDLTDIPEEKQEEAAEKLQTAVAQITSSITNALTNQTQEFKEALAEMISGIDTVAAQFGNLTNGENAKVYPKQTLSDVQMESSIVVDETTGEVKVEAVIKSMTFDIELMMDRLTADGSGVLDSGISINVPEDNTKTMRFPIPLPAEGISSTAKYAKVTHKGEISYSRIRTQGNYRYTIVEAKHFSPFTLEFVDEVPSGNPPSSSSGRSGGGHSSSGSGSWTQGVSGWKFKNANGSYAVNTWKSLLWNGAWQWYRFDQNGYMVNGWYTDVDGNKYFLHNVADGRQGYMYTGWKQINGKWYYFRDNTGGPLGSLLVNGATPDGHVTGADGSCDTYQGPQN